MNNKTISTLDNYKVSDLCKTGGLQEIYDLSEEAANEVCDLSTAKGRKRQKSLAAQVSSSKVLFEKACRGFVQAKKQEIKDIVEPAEKEIRMFVKAMDALRDKTKEPVLILEQKEKDEEEAYKIAEQMVIKAEKEAAERRYQEEAKITAHLEAIIQNLEYNSICEDEMQLAKFHFENKENMQGKFDADQWKESKKQEQEQAKEEAKNKQEDRFVMPVIKTSASEIVDFVVLGAAEDMNKKVPAVSLDKCIEICEAIKRGEILNIELVD